MANQSNPFDGRILKNAAGRKVGFWFKHRICKIDNNAAIFFLHVLIYQVIILILFVGQMNCCGKRIKFQNTSSGMFS